VNNYRVSLACPSIPLIASAVIIIKAQIIKMFFFKVDDFQNLSDTPENKNIHTKKRRETLALETALLEIGRSRGKVLLNSDGLTYKDFNHKLVAANQIWATLDKQ
jgi:hypothetical protein